MIRHRAARSAPDMKEFLGEDFLLSTDTGRRLYRNIAATQPILDFHCHLSAREIAENRRFQNVYEIWLEGDHYKWRAMRANGVPEQYCTGQASAYEKFLAWARTVPKMLRNPLYHWTHLELRRYFGIHELLDESSAPSIWERANVLLAGLNAHSILQRFRVQVICTTDDPTSDLRHHRAIANSKLATRVFPTFRPDQALAANAEHFGHWLDALSEASNTDIHDLNSFLDGLRNRHTFFHALGCRLSDHGLDHCYTDPCSDREAAKIFSQAREGKSMHESDQAKFRSFLMLFLGRLDSERGWTKQLHLGALRNVNSAALRGVGPDTGFDAMGDFPQISHLAGYLDLLGRENALPRMILYNANPADTFAFATLIGSFQDGSLAGKIQYGSAWWFLDQKLGMTAQLEALSNAGLLANFVGMVTDSRSFMSYPRHEYFRRILCDIVGRDVERGELPSDDALLGMLIRDVCFANAKKYLHLPE